MAVDGITGSNPVLFPVPGSRPEPVSPSAPAAAPSFSATVAAPAATQVSTALLESARLLNETLGNLVFPAGATGNLLSDTSAPVLTALTLTRELDFLLRSLLQVNATLQNLGGVPATPANPLLIDALPPALEASGVLDELDPARQNVLFVNEVLRDLGAVSPESGVSRAATPAAVPTPQAATGAGPTTAPLQTGEAVRPATEADVAAQVAAAAVPSAPPEAAPIPVAARFLTPEFTPATLPLSLFPDRTPYVLAVYQVNDPAPRPGPPEPIGREVAPAAPIVGVRPPGDARLRQLLFRAREGGRLGSVEYISRNTVGQAEKSIRHTLGQVNEEMAAHGLPLHLVFAKNENGFALDVYDCSYDEACRLSYNVPIPLDRLAGVLGNLSRETGVIVDTTS